MSELQGEPDLYISGAAVRPAMHGDRVAVALSRRRRGRLERVEGQVVNVLERATTRLVGVFRQGRTGAFLLPQDPRVTYRVRLETDSAGAESHTEDDRPAGPVRDGRAIPGTRPDVRRGDAGAIPDPRPGLRPRDGDLVVAEITRYPGPYDDIAARLVDVLGPASDPGVETEAIALKHDLPRAFPEPVVRQAAALPRQVEIATLPATLPAAPSRVRPWHESVASAQRLDLRELPLVTIDGDNARDFDDAVAVLDGPDGHTRLLIAIADVAAYVSRGSPLDLEARARGTSVYFPDRVVPMLPEALSNGICSLNPQVDRLVQAVLLDCDRRGHVLGAAFFPGVIRSRARLTYTEVREIVQDGNLATRRRHASLVDDLERMAALGEVMRTIRQRRGSIDLDLPEAEIVVDLRGRPENVVKAERTVAHEFIESFMLAANEAVARYLTSRRVPMPYRIHEPPDEDAVRDLARFLAGFGLHLAVSEGSVKPTAFQRVLAAAVGRPEERLVNTVLLRSMKRARYAPQNAGHFGLATDCYTHFTSPIRRYPDLALHRLLAAHLGAAEREIAAITAELPAICEESSRRERVAMDAEREVAQLWKVQFMQDKIGDAFTGFISGVVPFGVFVELERFFVDGLVHVATLTDDRYEFVEERHELRGRRRGRVLRLGDPVTVRVAAVSIERKQIDLTLIDLPPEERRRRS